MDGESSAQLTCQMNAVFSNEIILEVILTNLRSDSVNEILQLRLVSKLWHKITFKVFRRLAITPININFKQWSYPSFRFNISSQCNLPIGVVITNLVLKPKELNFFKSFSKHVVQVSFECVEENDDEGRKPFPTVPYQLHLPKLETVKVVLPQSSKIYYPRQSSAFKLVETFLQSTKKLKVFEVVKFSWDWNPWVRPLLSKEDFGPTSCEIPSNVTSLQWGGCCWSKYLSDCLLEAQLPNLQNLQIGVSYVFKDGIPSFDQVVNKFSSSLVKLVLEGNLGGIPFGILQLSVNSQMKHLRSLELNNVQLRSGSTPWTDLLPELRNVNISTNKGNAHVYATLNALAGNGLEEFSKTNSLTIDVPWGWADEELQALPELVLKPFRTLKHLYLGRYVPEDLIKILPGVFINLTELEYLQIQIGSEGNEMGITKLLTGVREEEIPAEESLWNGMLEGNVHSINNLKRLRVVKMDVSSGNDICRGIISGFAFAALLMISHLKRLELEGYDIVMDPNYKRKWIESNRRIDLKVFKGVEKMVK